MAVKDIGMLFQFIGGLGMFLYGMHVMAEGLQQSAGGKMKTLLGYLTNNRLLAVLVGALITAIIQSSSATTVMVVGFVNAQILTLTQAVGVIMGANIGTTVTAWLVSMSEWGEMMKPEFFAPVLVGIGALFIVFMKKEKLREIGEIILGFGILFIGLSFMSGAIKPYRDAPIFGQIFATLGKNPILGILAGAAVTAIIQSSSASVGILQTLALNGVVGWKSAVFITLGQNIGTCVTALISSAGAHKTAKRAAIIHLLFNVCGSVIFGIIMFVLFAIYPEWGNSQINSVQISVFHTIFNVANTIIMFPFAGLLVNLSGKLLRGTETEDEKSPVVEMKNHLDQRILQQPSFALETAEDQVVFMGFEVYKNIQRAVNALVAPGTPNVTKIFEREKDINMMERMLTEYLVQINNLALTETQTTRIKNLLYTVSDLERMGDHAENLAELTENKRKENVEFGEVATEDLQRISNTVLAAVHAALDARHTGNPEDVRHALQLEEEVDNLEDELRETHMERLTQGVCLPSHSVIFLDAISNLERISDHADNIASYVKNEL